MNALFVALGIMVLTLLALLLWFVPHLLQQQATRVAGETSQLREMLLDLLNEQEAVTMRQTQLGSSLSQLQDQIHTWIESRQNGAHAQTMQDNESWAYLMSLLSAIQERVGILSRDRASALAGLQAGALLEELEQ